MYYYKARIYSPTLGRFLQVDPIGYDDQVNLYAYVDDDPVNRVDPTGLNGEPGEAWANGAEYLNYRGRMSSASTPSEREQIALRYRTNFDAKGLGHLANQANYDSQESTRGLQKLYANGHVPTRGELNQFADAQGWKRTQRDGGPVIFVDGNGTARLTIKDGSARTPGSEGPHISYRDAEGQRRDPVSGKPVARKTEGNHRPFLKDKRSQRFNRKRG